MKTYKNTQFVKRDYECTNIVACRCKETPKRGEWAECDESILFGLKMLGIEHQNGQQIEMWGWL